MIKRIGAVAAAAMLGAGAMAFADEGAETKTLARASSPEFQELQQLVGTWKGTAIHPGKDETPEPLSIKFKMTAADSAIEETLMPGTPHEMVDMYVDENGKLAMTHYCAIGNHPHMVLKQSGPTKLDFEMGAMPGIDTTKDHHMHALTLEFPDANHLTERWTSYKNGKPGETVIFTLVRVSKKKF